jgi:hypothetical protein
MAAENQKPAKVTLGGAVELVEASAFRITPTYVYGWKYKDGNKALGLTPVRIKHPNVWKHINDLVDPEPGSELANTVIGEIPKHYNAASDLKMKDSSKKVSDVMTKDGPSDEAELINPAKTFPVSPVSAPPASPVPVPMIDPTSPGGVDLNTVAASYLNDPKTALSKFLSLIGFNKTPDSAAQLLKNPKVAGALLKNFGANWKEQAVAAGFVVPGKDAPPPPPPAPPPLPPEVANAATVLGYKDGSSEVKALEALHKHGNDVDALVALAGGDDASEAAFADAAKFINKVLAAAKKKKLVTTAPSPDDDEIDVVTFSAVAAPAPVPATPPAPAPVPAAPAPPAPTPSAPQKPVPTGFAVLDLASLKSGPEGIAIQNPEGFTFVKKGGKWFLQGIHAADEAALAGQAFKVVAAPPPEASAPVPPTPVPEPVTTPKATPTASVSGGLGLPAIPNFSTLSASGSAMGLGGKHAKTFLKDASGNTFLFKPATNKAPAEAAAAYSRIAATVFGSENAVPVVTGTVAGLGFGSVQPMIPNLKTDLSKVTPEAMTPSQLERVMKERVLDWALASHDAKAGNFVVTADGSVVGIDKDQSLKLLGKDSLDNYNPNPSPQLASTLFGLFRKKKLDLPVGAMLPAIKAIEAIPDDQWRANLSAYADANFGDAAAKKKFLDDAVQRKKNVRKDLEAFLTTVMQERGDLTAKQSFKFEEPEATSKKRKKKTPEGGLPSIPSSGSVLSPAAVPAISTLTSLGAAAGLGGAGEKYLFGDSTGGKWLLKLARSKNKGKNEEFRVAAQTMFSQVSAVVRPGKSIPIAKVEGGWTGVPATLQPMVPLASNAAIGAPETLTPSEKQDVAEEHALDWLMSQHDTHSGNFVRRADGTLLSVDKEQGFRFMVPGVDKSAPLGDSLSISYSPNPTPPYYNSFWKAFADGKMDFDPAVMKGAIERIESIPDAEYTQLLSQYAATSKFKDNPKAVALFLQLATDRKKNIRKDFEGFISDLYEKRTKKKGTFTFAGGWSGAPTPSVAPAPAAPTAPAATVAAPPPVVAEPPPPPPPDPKKNEGYAFQSPTSTGKLGVIAPELVVGNQPQPAWVPPPPPPPPSVPPGYAAPPAGKMWKVQPVGSLFQEGGDVVYKVKPPKPLDGTIDSTIQIVKFKQGEPAVKKLLDQAGVALEKPLVTKGSYTIAVVKKDAWGAMMSSGKTLGVLVDLPPPPTPPPAPSGTFTPIPKAGSLTNPEATNDIAVLANIASDKQIGYGKNIVVDGPAVENQSMRVMREVDSKGKEFYKVTFKLRAPYLKDIGGVKATYTFNRTAYDTTKDAFVYSGAGGGNMGEEVPGLNKMALADGGGSSVYVGVAPQAYSFRGAVIANVYPEPGENVADALKRVLTKVSPKMAKDVLRDSTPEEKKLQKLSALYWALAPQASDKLQEKDRTVENLTKLLSDIGVSQQEMDSIRQEEVALGIAVPVLPGRHKKIQALQNVSNISVGVSSPEKVIKQLLSGTQGVNNRALQGLPLSGATSAHSDQITGGADYVFTCAAQKDGTRLYTGWGSISMVYDPAVLDRLDAFSHPGDYYGVTDPAQKGGAFEKRVPLEKSTKHSAEVCFKGGLNSRQLLKVAVPSTAVRSDLLQKMAAAGITEVNGMKPEDLVVVVQDKDTGKFYETQLKPAGY